MSKTQNRTQLVSPFGVRGIHTSNVPQNGVKIETRKESGHLLLQWPYILVRGQQ